MADAHLALEVLAFRSGDEIEPLRHERVLEEDVVLPTYGTGRPDRNPMFFEKRVYQGSSGVVYPYPVVEKVEDVVHVGDAVRVKYIGLDKKGRMDFSIKDADK